MLPSPPGTWTWRQGRTTQGVPHLPSTNGLLEQSGARTRANLDCIARCLGIRRQQAENVAAEPSADDARASRARVDQPLDGRLDRGGRDLVVVAQAGV